MNASMARNMQTAKIQPVLRQSSSASMNVSTLKAYMGKSFHVNVKIELHSHSHGIVNDVDKLIACGGVWLFQDWERFADVGNHINAQRSSPTRRRSWRHTCDPFQTMRRTTDRHSHDLRSSCFEFDFQDLVPARVGDAGQVRKKKRSSTKLAPQATNPKRGTEHPWKEPNSISGGTAAFSHLPLTSPSPVLLSLRHQHPPGRCYSLQTVTLTLVARFWGDNRATSASTRLPKSAASTRTPRTDARLPVTFLATPPSRAQTASSSLRHTPYSLSGTT